MYLKCDFPPISKKEGVCWEILLTTDDSLYFEVDDKHLPVLEKLKENGWEFIQKDHLVFPMYGNAYRYALSIILREGPKYLDKGIEGIINNPFGRWSWKTKLDEASILKVLKKSYNQRRTFYSLMKYEKTFRDLVPVSK